MNLNKDEKKKKAPPPPSPFKITKGLSLIKRRLRMPANYNQGNHNRCCHWSMAQILNLLVQLHGSGCTGFHDDDELEITPKKCCKGNNCVSLDFMAQKPKISHYYSKYGNNLCNNCYFEKCIKTSLKPSISTVSILNDLLNKIGDGADIESIFRCIPLFRFYDHENGEIIQMKWSVTTETRPPVPMNGVDAAKWRKTLKRTINMNNNERLKLFAMTVQGNALSNPRLGAKNISHCMMIQEMKYNGACVGINSWGESISPNPLIQANNILHIHSISIDDMRVVKDKIGISSKELNLTKRGYELCLSPSTPHFIRHFCYHMIDIHPFLKHKVDYPSSDNTTPRIDVARFNKMPRRTPDGYIKHWKYSSPISFVQTNIVSDILSYFFTYSIQNAWIHYKKKLKGQTLWRLNGESNTDISMLRFDFCEPTKPSKQWYNSKAKPVGKGIDDLLNSLHKRYFSDTRNVRLMIQFIFRAFEICNPQSFGFRYIRNTEKCDRGIFEFWIEPGADINELKSLYKICISSKKDTVFSLAQIIDELPKVYGYYECCSKRAENLIHGYLRQERNDWPLPQMIVHQILTFTNSFAKSAKAAVTYTGYCGLAAPYSLRNAPSNEKSVAETKHPQIMTNEASTISTSVCCDEDTENRSESEWRWLPRDGMTDDENVYGIVPRNGGEICENGMKDDNIFYFDVISDHKEEYNNKAADIGALEKTCSVSTSKINKINTEENDSFLGVKFMGKTLDEDNAKYSQTYFAERTIKNENGWSKLTNNNKLKSADKSMSITVNKTRLNEEVCNGLFGILVVINGGSCASLALVISKLFGLDNLFNSCFVNVNDNIFKVEVFGGVTFENASFISVTASTLDDSIYRDNGEAQSNDYNIKDSECTNNGKLISLGQRVASIESENGRHLSNKNEITKEERVNIMNNKSKTKYYFVYKSHLEIMDIELSRDNFESNIGGDIDFVGERIMQ